MSRYVNALNATNYLNNNINKIIDVFVNYYGEDKREEIMKKFNEILLIGYQSPSAASSLLLSEKKQISTELFKIAIEKSGVEKNLYDSILNAFNTTFEHLKYSDFSLCYEFVSRYKTADPITYENDYRFGRIIDILKKIYPDINMDNVYNYLENGKLEFIKKINVAINEAKIEYDRYYEENIKEMVELNEKLNKDYSRLKIKGYINVIEDYKHLLNDKDKEEFENKKNNSYFSSYGISGIEIFFGSSLQNDSALDFFSDESDKILNNNSSKYLKDTVKNNRIKYFKYKGFDLGDNYDDYISNPEVLNIFPKKELIEEIRNKKNDYLNDINNKYYSSIPDYQENQRKIDSLKLVDKDISYNPAAYITSLTCVNPNIKLTEKGYELFSLILIYANASEYDDVKIIHEFNHLYELSLLNVSNNSYQMICGWDIIDGKVNQNMSSVDTINIEKTKRDYELFNEIINELIAQEITIQMHGDGIYLLNTKDDAKIKGGTSYESSISLVKEFFNTYKKEIIESRRNNNIQIIFDKVGKENFDRLNELFHKFYESFSGWEFYNLSTDINNKKNTERVRIYVDIINTRDEILKDMKIYSEKNLNVNTI